MCMTGYGRKWRRCASGRNCHIWPWRQADKVPALGTRLRVRVAHSRFATSSGALGRDHYAPRSFFFARKARNASGLFEEIFPPGCAMLQAIFARSIKTRKVMDQCIPSASECRRLRHFRVRSFDVRQGDNCPRGIRTRWAHPVRHRSTAVDSRRPAHAGPQRLM